MYLNSITKYNSIQGFSERPRGFTLVEIMIVIVIILLLTQLGNVAGLFRTRDKSKIEEIAVGIVALMDEGKINTLLGKTEDGNIARKRKLGISRDNSTNSITLTAETNLASEAEWTFSPESKKEKKWKIDWLETEFYGCSSTGSNAPLSIDAFDIEFVGDKIRFVHETETLPPHIIFLLKHVNASHEIHVDYRTGLTYERRGVGKNTDGEWPVFCN